jgi:transcriptional regulator with XRE-family HTH domain
VSTFDEVWPKLKRSKRYREEFVAQHAKQAIPFQISALLKHFKLTQAELASRAGLTQGVVSRAADPSYGNLTLNTLVRIAAGFDVAFVGRFVPFTELAKWFDRIYSEEFKVESFDAENAEQEAVSQELLARALAEKSNVTRMDDFLGKQLKSKQRMPPKHAKSEAQERGSGFHSSRGGYFLRPTGENESLPQG